MVRGLIKGVVMLLAGAAITWGVAGALQHRATVSENTLAAHEKPAPAQASSKPPTSHWMF